MKFRRPSTETLNDYYRRVNQLKSRVQDEEPFDGIAWWKASVLNTARFFIVLWRELLSHSIFQRAAALTYTTILSLFPLFVLITSVASVFYDEEQEEQLIDFIQARLLPPSDAGMLSPWEAMKQDERQEDIAGLVDGIRKMSTDYRKSAGSVGFVGFLGVLFTAGLLFRSIEDSFEVTWESGKKRTIARTVMGFTTLVVFTPMVVGVSITASSFVVALVSDKKSDLSKNLVTAVIVTEPVYHNYVGPPTEKEQKATVESVGVIPVENGAAPASEKVREEKQERKVTVLSLLLGTIPVAINSIIMAIAYSLLPQSRVKWRYAVLGGVTAAILWEMAKSGFFFYVWFSATRREVLKSLGAVPLFLIWLYFTWVVFLLGNEIAFVSQNFRRLNRQHLARIRVPIYDGRLLAAITLLIADSYERGDGGLMHDTLLRITRVSSRELEKILSYLEQNGFITTTAKGAYIPARSAHQIRLSELLHLGCDTQLIYDRRELSRRPEVFGALEFINARLKADEDDHSLAELLQAASVTTTGPVEENLPVDQQAASTEVDDEVPTAEHPTAAKA